MKKPHQKINTMRLNSLLALLLCIFSGLTYASNHHTSVFNARGIELHIIDESFNFAFHDSPTQHIIEQALSLTGTPYHYGGSSPETGFDCSGFVRYVFNQFANIDLPRTSASMSTVGQSVRKEELQPGDLIFFNTSRKPFSHVAIYIGDNQFIHAPRKGRNVEVENIEDRYWASRYDGAKRIEMHLAQ
jgi:cell wall-associated NlpC family hydrolase